MDSSESDTVPECMDVSKVRDKDDVDVHRAEGMA